MERRDRQVVVYFVVALAASVGLALAIAYFEVRRGQEQVSLLHEVQRLQREVERLKEELENRTIKFNARLNKLVSEESLYYTYMTMNCKLSKYEDSYSLIVPSFFV